MERKQSSENVNEKQWCATGHSSNDREWAQISENIRFLRFWSKSVIYDESPMKALNLTGQPVGLNVAGIHGTSDIRSKRLRIKIGDQDGTIDDNILPKAMPR